MEKVATCIFAARFTQQNYPKKELGQSKGYRSSGDGSCVYVYKYMHSCIYIHGFIYLLPQTFCSYILSCTI